MAREQSAGATERLEEEWRLREHLKFVARHLGAVGEVAQTPPIDGQRIKILHDPKHPHHDYNPWPRQNVRPTDEGYSLCTTCFDFEGTRRQLDAEYGPVSESLPAAVADAEDGQGTLAGWSA